MSNTIINNYNNNVRTVSSYTPSQVYLRLVQERRGRTGRTTQLKFTLLTSIISNLPIIKQHKRYLWQL